MSKVANQDLTKKLIEKNKEIEELKELYDKRIRRLKKENAKLLKNKVLLSDEEKYKEIIRLYAFGFNTGNIFKILSEEKGQDVTLSEVGGIVDKVDYLPPAMHKYYLECKEDFKKKTQLDQGFFASSVYKKYMLLENEASESLALAKELGDEQQKIKCIDRLIKIYDKMGKAFSKDGIASSGEQNIDTLMEDYEEEAKQSEKIIKFSTENIRRVR